MLGLARSGNEPISRWEGKGVNRQGDEVPSANGNEPEDVDAQELLRDAARAIAAVRRGVSRWFDQDGIAEEDGGDASTADEGDEQKPEA